MIDWDNLPDGMDLATTSQTQIARRMGTTTAAVQRARRCRGIAPPNGATERGRWPSDAELRRQNEAAGDRRAEEVRSVETVTGGSSWMGGSFIPERKLWGPDPETVRVNERRKAKAARRRAVE